MGKATQRRIDFVLKRKRDETSENEDALAATNDILPLLQLEQQQQNNWFKASDICEMVKKYYPADFPQDIYGLQQQLKHFVLDASKDEELKKISTLIDLCRCLVETGRHIIYNLIDRLLRLLITLPVSTASAERVFSILKIIKTRLRNKMEDDNLANNMLVHIEGAILDDYKYDDVIFYFKSIKDRAADL
jgi:hypothetical protein